MGTKYSYPRVDMSGKTVIVTGANTGIGYETAKQISMMGAKVIVACRSEDKAMTAIRNMKSEFSEWLKEGKESKTSGGKKKTKEEQTTTEVVPLELDLEFMKLDLSSLQSVKNFIEEFRSKHSALHVLICNAGIASPPLVKTEDGYESQFQINYLSHFLLTIQFLPLLKSSGPGCRVINVSSVAHSSGKFEESNLQGERSYSRLYFYSHSKLFQVMSMFSFQRRLEGSGVSIISLHPGAVDTDVSRSFDDSAALRRFWKTYRKLGILVTLEKGAATSIDVAVNPEYDNVSGVYHAECKRKTPCASSRNVDKQEKLWKYSLNCLKDYIDDDILRDLEKHETSTP
ncbi:retinol dehydrogenase 12-like [Glandiceps talaboti]